MQRGVRLGATTWKINYHLNTHTQGVKEKDENQVKKDRTPSNSPVPKVSMEHGSREILMVAGQKLIQSEDKQGGVYLRKGCGISGGKRS